MTTPTPRTTPLLNTLAAAHFGGNLPALLNLLTTLDDATIMQIRVERAALLGHSVDELTPERLRAQAASDEQTARHLRGLKAAELRNGTYTVDALNASDLRIEAYDHLAQLLDNTHLARLSLALTLQEQGAVGGR